MSSESKYILVGLQNAGKTTFLAALWYLVQNRSFPAALQLDRLDGSAKYLNLIRKDWLEYRKVPRTYTASEKVVSMQLADRASSRKMTLHFPDLAGESFENQWVTRQWTQDYVNTLRTSAGGLLFINPVEVRGGKRIDQADALIAGLDLEPSLEQSEQHPSGEIPPWDKRQSPTQVQLVEILQFIKDHGGIQKPFRLAIMVSAWDCIPVSVVNPDLWVRKQLPLLSQFLIANRRAFSSEFFGVSAQGGEYAESVEENGQEPMSQVEPFKRIKIVGRGIENEHDITIPLQWLIS